MDRLISEQAAIDAMSEALKRVFPEHRQIAEKCLNALPSAQPEQQWLPVSERLPETNDDVLVYDGVDMFVAWYARKGMWQGWNSTDNNFERDTPIVAWMPLPKTYEGE